MRSFSAKLEPPCQKTGPRCGALAGLRGIYVSKRNSKRSYLVFLNHDAAASNGLRLGGVDVGRRTYHVVTDDRARCFVPDLDPELSDAVTVSNPPGYGIAPVVNPRGAT